ncbi:hypothetical protein IC582_027454 [Cucumis melo]
MKTNHRVRQRDNPLKEKPLKAIAKKPHGSSHEHHNPQRKIQESNTRAPPKGLTKVRSHRQIIELHLRHPESSLQIGRIRREIKICASKCLNPYRRHKHHPFSCLRRIMIEEKAQGEWLGR